MRATRYVGYITHTLHDLLKQRIYQIASGYQDGNDRNALRHDPVFRLDIDHKPFDVNGVNGAPASGSTISRFEHAANARDIYRRLRNPAAGAGARYQALGRCSIRSAAGR